MESTRFRDAVALLEGSVSTRVVVVRPRRAAADPVFADFYQALADSNTTILVDTVFLQSLHAMRHLTDILVIQNWTRLMLTTIATSLSTSKLEERFSRLQMTCSQKLEI